jgi:subtilisin
MTEAYLNERAEHIVVFRKVSEKNIDILSKVLGVGEAVGLSARASCAVLQPTHENGVHTRIYRNLAVAVTTLSKDRQIELEQMDDIVLSIHQNELRCIPPLVKEFDFVDPLSAYLQGMRDAIDAVQRFHTGMEPTPFASISPQTMSFSRTWSWCLDTIGITPGYDLATGNGIKVAVLDTGIDLNHPDFQDRLLENDNTKSWIREETVQDGNGHGTHCAGIIAGPRMSASGKRYGVAPDVDLLICKVLDNRGYGYDDDILDAMDWARDKGAKIISMSLVSEKENNRSISQPFSDAYEQIASVLLAQGTLVVAASGNSSVRPRYTKPVDNPAACQSVMAVAAVDSNRKIASFSCAQMDEIGLLDISAPGVGVYSAYKDRSFGSLSGTSMATPHVAGVAALYFQLYPDLSAREIWDKIVADALPLGNREDYGYGLVQAPSILMR